MFYALVASACAAQWKGSAWRLPLRGSHASEWAPLSTKLHRPEACHAIALCSAVQAVATCWRSNENFWQPDLEPATHVEQAVRVRSWLHWAAALPAKLQRRQQSRTNSSGGGSTGGVVRRTGTLEPVFKNTLKVRVFCCDAAAAAAA